MLSLQKTADKRMKQTGTKISLSITALIEDSDCPQDGNEDRTGRKV